MRAENHTVFCRNKHQAALNLFKNRGQAYSARYNASKNRRHAAGAISAIMLIFIVCVVLILADCDCLEPLWGVLLQRLLGWGASNLSESFKQLIMCAPSSASFLVALCCWSPTDNIPFYIIAFIMTDRANIPNREP